MTWFWVRKGPKFQFPELAILAAAAAIGGVKPSFIYNHLPVAYAAHKGQQLTNILKKLIENWQDFRYMGWVYASFGTKGVGGGDD